ncbi:flagellar basal body protein, partial [Pseudomonas aeruginosa]|uniref:flagellar basal body protein n=1 Tax=Pseudomonas aeruginosa TaxID=287 RepID=UPI00396F4EFA
MKTAPLFICGVKRRRGRLGNIENGYSQCEKALLEASVNSSLYIGATGMKGLAEGMNVTTNNIANISTIGYK